ncbi:hypothetical protein M422DRAFT_48239 [Sphaerobolus stellatus SS14]|uniref:L-tyrosine decarboxylase C-terminal domain-containing protein n=1 Tax=Sphaerobolus stellatus (strain SS14) TaxID=990650 RepID=A0A0C9VL30_SPHS4|nr:hypothetical protein M422DRAFT_48239 [Sphaerobolus stellatus SS14]
MPSSHIYGPSTINPNNLHESISAWFLGPQGENTELFMNLIGQVISDQVRARQGYHPEDGKFIQDSLKLTDGFKEGAEKLREKLGYISGLLAKYSIPFYSPRYMGHMTCFKHRETSMPAITGLFATVLYNPNNVAFEASPITTSLEIKVGKQFCDMLGYNLEPSKGVVGWGHICCDGTVANLESVWSARNLKFYPPSLREAMEPGKPFNFIASMFKVPRCNETGEPPLFKDLSNWELLNLRSHDILDIPHRLFDEYGITPTYLDNALKHYIIQATSKDSLQEKYSPGKPPHYMATSTRHYSWPKSAALAGIGSNNLLDIPIDNNARMDISKLKKELEQHFKDRHPIYAIVGIIGSTEEGAVDPLDEIIALRNEYEKKGMYFLVHADAAWGGYFASMISETFNPYPDEPDIGKSMPPPVDEPQRDRDYVPSITLRKSTVNQFHALKDADSITIDPHKSGYVPYPAGGLCYKDERMRFQVTWTAPYIVQGDNGESIGIYGVEGSKPGAPAVATYLQHLVIEPTKYGHGGLLGEVSFACRRIAAHWAAMSDSKTDYIVVPFNPLRDESSPSAIEKEKLFIRKNILGRSNEDLVADQPAMDELCALGSDLNINAFSCNFRINGKPNDDVEEANRLNKRLFERFSITKSKVPSGDVPLFLSSTTFAGEEYGQCADNFKRRLGMSTTGSDLFVLRNVVMSPFPVAGDFVSGLAKIFETALKEEVKHITAESTITNHHHTFIMQGVEKPLHLVYRPLFYNANCRFQLIVSADLDEKSWKLYSETKKKNPGVTYALQTVEETTVENILKAGSFKATLSGKNFPIEHIVTVQNIKVVKNRPLDSKYRDPGYPVDNMPFYLYGSANEMHVDHMLLHAPNAQITAESVKIKWDQSSPALTNELGKGIIALFDRREATMQPFRRDANDPDRFFKSGATFGITMYKDVNAPNAHGPGLSTVDEKNKLGKGTITLLDGIFTDVEALNVDEFSRLVDPEDKDSEDHGMTHKKLRHPFIDHKAPSHIPTHQRGKPRGYLKEHLPSYVDEDNVPESLDLPVSGPLGDLRAIRHDHGTKSSGKANIADRGDWNKIISGHINN